MNGEFQGEGKLCTETEKFRVNLDSEKLDEDAEQREIKRCRVKGVFSIVLHFLSLSPQ